MDVTREADVVQLVTRAQQAFGRLDIMICNAGFGYYGTVEETDPDVMRRMMDVNFMGTFYGTRAALPVFRRQGHGHLIFVSSIVGKRGIPLMSGYSATKAAQAVFAESLRSEFAGTDIHVSAVFPVSTTTEFRDAMERDFGHQVSGLGPKQSGRARRRARSCACIRAARGRGLSASRRRAGWRSSTPSRPAFTDRLVRKYGRRRVVAPATSGSDANARPMSIETATAIAQLVREHGGRALVVGGWVRDRLLGRPGKDVDVEVYGLPAPRLKALLETLAPVNTVGESFTVYKVARRRRVAAAPRVEDRPRAQGASP